MKTLPLSALLSQVLVAFTIEFDNEFERLMTHRTTRDGVKKGAAGYLHAPWLVSMVMWFNCMRFVPDEGITSGNLERLARTETNLAGMQRWGYVAVVPNPSDPSPKRRSSSLLIVATPAGREAQEVWLSLIPAIEHRWQDRYGRAQLMRLRGALAAIAERLDRSLPDCLPILKYGLFSHGSKTSKANLATNATDTVAELSLASLLSRVLLAFALEFERDSELSLAICANLLRILDAEGTRVRDLPVLSGVSKEAIGMAMGILKKKQFVTECAAGRSSSKIVRLTPSGERAKVGYQKLLGEIEERWRVRFGEDAILALRQALEPLVGNPGSGTSPLVRAIEPHPDSWRASVRRPDSLPHFPMVLHRGGFPDGS